MDNPDSAPLTQADITLLRSFINRLPAIAPAPQAPIAGNPASISAPAALRSTHPSVSTPQVPVSSTTQPITSYQPAALRNPADHVTSNTGHPIRTAPSQSILNHGNPTQFQGIQSLGAGVTRQIVNQQRLAHAAATIPRQPALQARNVRRGRRPGSTNANPPGLPPAATMNNALVTNDDGSTSLKIRAKVYPPTENTNSELVLFTNYSDSFNATLESYFLIHEYEVQPSSTLGSLTAKIVADMASCPLEYEFSTRFPEGIVRHEAVPIRLLALTNHGRCRPTTGQVYLQRMAISAATPMSEIFANRNFYSNSRLCLENDRFVLHFVVVHHPFSAKLPVENTTETRRHRCISYRVYRQFPYDGYTAPTNLEDIDPYDSSGGELSDEESADSESDNDALAQQPQDGHVQWLQLPPSNQLHRQTPASASAFRGFEVGTRPTGPQGRHTPAAVLAPGLNLISQTSSQSTSLLISRFLPATIWESNWSPPAIRNRIEDLDTIEDVPRYIYDKLGSATGRRVSIRGKSVQDLAARFRYELVLAAGAKDFTAFFSPEREFIVENTDGTIRSLGAGVEAEVLYLAFQQLQDNPGQWFYPRVDNAASIATMHTFASSSVISNARREGMCAFGALTALLLIHGIPPLPLSPMFLQWIINGCDLNALHSDLISEWHPELSATIKQWITAGPTGPLIAFQSHFSTWHDTQIGLYNNRDEAGHKAIAAEMLYRSLIGSEPPDHPEIQAFIAGFRLPCHYSSTFDFLHVLKSFSGGTELYLSLVWTSQIKSFNDLAPYIHFRPAPTALTDQAFSLLGEENSTLSEVLSRFLKLSGIPCPRLFDDAKPHFSELINLDKVDDPSFRTRMFCWAATGCPSMATDSGDITVYLVNDNDGSYSLPSFRDAMLSEGKISFKTCSRQVRIPASHFEALSLGCYDESMEPKSLENAIHHWFLCEILNAIGHHSML